MACVPIVGATPWVFYAVALDDEVTGTTTGRYGAVIVAFVAKCFGPTNAPPEGDAAVFDDNVMTAFGNADAVDGGVFEFETPNDDVVGIDGDVVIGLVAHIKCCSGFGWGREEVVFIGCAGFCNFEGGRLGCDVCGFADGELIV